MSKSNKQNKTNNVKKKRNIEKARLECKIEVFLENGRKEITTKKQLEKYTIGSLISYMNKSNIFRPGGFIIKFAEEYFIYISPDFKTKYRARYKNIQKMWVGDVYKVKHPTNFEIKVNDIIIYYAKDSYDTRRFKHTDKYKRLIAWNDYFNNDK